MKGMKENISGAGNDASSRDTPGVASGISATGDAHTDREYTGGVIHDDNVMASGAGGYARASRRATIGPVSRGFKIDGGK